MPAEGSCRLRPSRRASSRFAEGWAEPVGSGSSKEAVSSSKVWRGQDSSLRASKAAPWARSVAAIVVFFLIGATWQGAPGRLVRVEGQLTRRRWGREPGSGPRPREEPSTGNWARDRRALTRLGVIDRIDPSRSEERRVGKEGR